MCNGPAFFLTQQGLGFSCLFVCEKWESWEVVSQCRGSFSATRLLLRKVPLRRQWGKGRDPGTERKSRLLADSASVTTVHAAASLTYSEQDNPTFSLQSGLMNSSICPRSIQFFQTLIVPNGNSKSNIAAPNGIICTTSRPFLPILLQRIQALGTSFREKRLND